MNQKRSSKPIHHQLLYLSLLPFIYALALSLANWLGWQELFPHEHHFIRLNSYIYAHSYGALLLGFVSGIKIGMAFEQPRSNTYVLLNWLLLVFAWFSHQSFADLTGILILLSGWLAAIIIDQMAKQNELLGERISRTLLTTQCIVILLLSLIAGLNG